jgi:hypothetical protein
MVVQELPLSLVKDESLSRPPNGTCKHLAKAERNASETERVVTSKVTTYFDSNHYSNEKVSMKSPLLKRQIKLQ